MWNPNLPEPAARRPDDTERPVCTGTHYAQSPVPGVRRLYLRRVAVHLYYTFDDARLIVRALWGARRERGPRIYQITLHGSPSSQSDSSALHAHYHVRCLPLEIGIHPAS